MILKKLMKFAYKMYEIIKLSLVFESSKIQSAQQLAYRFR